MKLGKIQKPNKAILKQHNMSIIDLRQTHEYATYMSSLGWDVENLEGEEEGYYVYVRNLPLIGKVAKLQRPSPRLSIDKVDHFFHKHNISILYLESSKELPHQLQEKYKFRFGKNPFLPSKTLQLNLSLKLSTVLSKMYKKTRYSIRLARKKKLYIFASHNIKAFITGWGNAAKKRGMFLPQQKEIQNLYQAFGGKARLLFSLPQPDSDRDKPIAGLLAIYSKNIAYYMYAFSSPEGNKLLAPTYLVWKAIQLAKTANCKIFDFEGICDERYKQTKSWQGFTRFKKGFGGKIIKYPPVLVKYHIPILKILGF